MNAKIKEMDKEKRMAKKKRKEQNETEKRELCA